MSRRRKGAVSVEFALVGIPLIFSIISTVEMSRGMWIYFTQTQAVREGARYIVVRGADCLTNGNTCSVTVGNIANALASAGVGLVPTNWNITLISASGSNNVSCTPLSSCLTNGTTWPPSPDNQVGSSVSISGSYPFASALSMFWPGSKAVSFGTFNLPAYSQQLIQY